MISDIGEANSHLDAHKLVGLGPWVVIFGRLQKLRGPREIGRGSTCNVFRFGHAPPDDS